jgi:hypothetical protein
MSHALATVRQRARRARVILNSQLSIPDSLPIVGIGFG